MHTIQTMLSLSLSLSLSLCSYSSPVFQQQSLLTSSPSRSVITPPYPPDLVLSRCRPLALTNCSRADYDEFDDDDFSDVKLESLSGDGVSIEIEKLGRNSRRIRSKVEIEANLETVWEVLTDYEKLVDYIPGLAVSELVEKKGNFVRLYQIGQQNLPFGLKFNAKGVLDCYEKDLEILPQGKKRDIDFKMIEGDFQLFEGKWSLEQFNREKCQDTFAQGCQTSLSYTVNVQPKLWLPVRLVEGRLSKEIKTNLSCIREAARSFISNALRSR